MVFVYCWASMMMSGRPAKLVIFKPCAAPCRVRLVWGTWRGWRLQSLPVAPGLCFGCGCAPWSGWRRSFLLVACPSCIGAQTTRGRFRVARCISSLRGSAQSGSLFIFHHNKGNHVHTSKTLSYVGFFNALALAIIAVLVFIESVERFYNPTEIKFNEAIVVSIIGLIVNLISVKILHHDEEHSDHNLKAKLLHSKHNIKKQ